MRMSVRPRTHVNPPPLSHSLLPSPAPPLPALLPHNYRLSSQTTTARPGTPAPAPSPRPTSATSSCPRRSGLEPTPTVSNLATTRASTQTWLFGGSRPRSAGWRIMRPAGGIPPDAVKTPNSHISLASSFSFPNDNPASEPTIRIIKPIFPNSDSPVTLPSQSAKGRQTHEK